jgi:hypothetical protein
MERTKLMDLEAEERAQSRAAGRLPGNAGFKERARRGYYGDIRLLGLSAGFILLFILSFLLRSEEVPLMATNTTVEEAVVFAPPVFAADEVEQNQTEAVIDASFVKGTGGTQSTLAVQSNTAARN